jgi:Protein of unknown function (DUF2946)
MDDIVKAAMAKWPNVPDCYGWLGLDARGNWYMRDDRVQAAGPFPRSKGSEDTPWVWRLQPDGRVLAHTGNEVQTQDCLLDESGRLYLATEVGVGLVHSADMALAADWIEDGRWSPVSMDHAALTKRWGFVRQPR